MNKLKNVLAMLVVAIVFTACGNQSNSKAEETREAKDVQEIVTSNTQIANEWKGNYCFKKVEDKDLTTVNLNILSKDHIEGEMVIDPYEKDRAVGTLKGKMISENEMRFIYDYMIEGEMQTEEVIMKIENGKLFIKKGELVYSENSTNLTYKDVSKATYSEVLDAVECK